jgi:hypothetical protein
MTPFGKPLCIGLFTNIKEPLFCLAFPCGERGLAYMECVSDKSCKMMDALFRPLGTLTIRTAVFDFALDLK